MKKVLLRFWPILYIFLLWTLFSSPYFFKGLVPYPSKHQVTFFAPWSAYEEWWGPVKNNAMPDIIDQIYPWKHFTIETIRQAQIPVWNPYNFAGNPHIANFQTAIFSPFNVFYFILPFIDAWSISVLIQPLLAAIFTYLLLKELRVSNLGSLISSVTYMFCGFMTVWMAYGTLSMAAAFLPLALFGIEKAFNTKKMKYFLLLTASLIISFFSGHFQTSLYVAAFSFVYIVFKVLYGKVISKKCSNWRIFSGALVFYCIGIIVSLLQIYPTIIFYLNSVRSEISYVGGGIAWNYLITSIVPDFYGNPVTRNDWFGTYAEWASFVGIVPFMLVLFSLFKNKNVFIRFFFISAVIVLLLAIESPIHTLLVATKIPIISTSIPSRIIVLFSFCSAILAGYGYDIVQGLVKEKKIKQIAVLLTSVFLFLSCIWILIIVFHALPEEKTSIAVKNLLLPTILFISIAGLLLFTLIIKGRYRIFILGAVLVVFATSDSYRYATKWMPFDSRDLVYPDVPVVKAMQKEIGYGRVFGNLGAQVETYYGLSSLEGYDPLYIQNYGEFIRYASKGTFEPAERSVVRIDRRGRYTDRVLDLLGVSLIFHPIADTFQNWAYPVWESEKNKIIYEDSKFRLYKNTDALPRVKLFYDYEVISDKKAILKRFYNDGFDFRNVLLVESNPFFKKLHPNPLLTGEGEKRNKAEIVSYTPNRITINIQTDKPGLVFLSDSYYPNWKVRVNGKKEKIFRANYAFRAVPVEKGESRIEFYYELF